MNRVSIIPFPPDAPEFCAAARRFNDRLAAGGYGEFNFSESHSSRAFPKAEGRATWMEYYLAVEDGPEVRGGYILRPQPWFSKGEPLELTFLKLPVSEGVINPEYASLGIELLQDANHRAPSVYALGMGGIQRKLPRILQKLGWEVVSVPFFFRVCRASRVLRQTVPMRSTPKRRVLCDVAAFSGGGALAFSVLQSLKKKGSAAGTSVVLEKDFGAWCDPIWRDCHAHYDWVGQRDSKTLPLIHPDGDPRFIRMRVCRGGQTVGWALGLCTDMSSHKQFGNLRVASIVDAMAKPEDAPAVIAAATRHLESLRPDLIVTNQQHRAWREAVVQAGFLSGPSNYALALSAEAYASLRAHGGTLDGIFLNRGDGDGPINL